jgi:hypothetical protein
MASSNHRWSQSFPRKDVSHTQKLKELNTYIRKIQKVEKDTKKPPDKGVSLIGKGNERAKKVTWWTTLRRNQMKRTNTINEGCVWLSCNCEKKLLRAVSCGKSWCGIWIVKKLKVVWQNSCDFFETDEQTLRVIQSPSHWTLFVSHWQWTPLVRVISFLAAHWLTIVAPVAADGAFSLSEDPAPAPEEVAVAVPADACVGNMP